jgi:hypothetical protein
MILDQEGKLVGITESGSTTIGSSGTTTFLLTTQTPSVAEEVHQFINDFRANSQTGPVLPPNIDQNGNGFTELQEHHLAQMAKKFHVGDTVALDLAAILYPLPAGHTLSVTGLPKGLSFDPASGVISGKIAAELGSAPVQLVLKKGGKVVGTLVFDLKVDPYKYLGGYEVLVENGGLPVGKALLRVTGPGGYTAALELQGQGKRSAKGAFANPPVGEAQTIEVTFPAGKGGVPAAATVAFTVRFDSDLVTGTLRGFRLAKSGRVPRQPCTVTFETAALGDRVNTPGGTGHATGAVSSGAVLALSGVLGDAQALVAGLNLSQTNQAVVFAQPYRDKSASFFGGILTLGDLGLPGRGAASESVTAGLQWRKIANAADLSYPLGIGVSAPVAVTGRVSRWVPVSTAEALGLSLGLAWREVFPTYTAAPGGSLPTLLSLNNSFSLLTVAPSVPVVTTLRATGSTGTFSGTMKLPAPAAGTTVRGVLLQDASFGTQVGAGLIKIPVTRTPAVRGSFETAGIRLGSE